MDDIDTTRTPSPGSVATGKRSYLLVIEGGSSSLVHLPRNGVVLVGRSPECDVRVEDPSASRRHAKLMMADGEARIADLESRSGTMVNGERAFGARSLGSGDVVTIGETTLVLRRGHRVPQTGRLLDGKALRERLDDEIERALAFERPLVLIALTVGGGVDRAAAGSAALGVLRRVDVAAWDGDEHLLALAPELDADEAESAVQRLVEALATIAPSARAGFASCPSDACDADALLAGARDAAAAAEPGASAGAGKLPSEISLGERSVVVADPATRRVYDLIRRLAVADLPVLISGETGVGKENAAYAVHHWSPRAGKPFVAINCAAIQETLVESELFGYEKGAFSGAVASKPGLLEAASGGTVFLDEIGELSPAVQAKLLRALEAKRVTRLGAVKDREIDIRVVAATNRDLEEEVRAGRFRQDLLFRLNTATVILLPLRERPREMAILARTFLDGACARLGRAPMTLSAPAMLRLARYAWPGNVRELKNVMEFVAAAVAEGMVEPWHLPTKLTGEEPASASTSTSTAAEAAPATEARFRPVAEELKEIERRRMVEALAATSGVQTKAAELIGMPLRTFVLKVKQYGLGKK